MANGQKSAIWTKVEAGGRVVIPAPFRRALGLEEGQAVLLVLEEKDGAVRLLTREAALKRAQDIVSRYVPAGVSLSEELIQERRAEAARE